MGRFVIILVAVLLLGVARAYSSDFDAESVPFLAKAGAKTPDYVLAMGTPAAIELPETDYTTWFSTEPPADGSTPDPYDVAFWKSVDAFFAASGTQQGWTEACAKAGEAAGAERATKPELGAVSCSSDPSVTLAQRFVVQLLGLRAETALWIRGVPGHSIHGVGARQAELRLMCGVEVIAREGGPDSPYASACASALETAYLAGDAPATFDTLGEAYTTIAAEIVRRDPTVDPEPGYYATGGSEKTQ